MLDLQSTPMLRSRVKRNYAPPANIGLDDILNAINVSPDLTVDICTPTGQMMDGLVPLNVTLLKQGTQYIESFLR